MLLGCGSGEEVALENITLERGPISLTVMPARGGQVSELRLAGEVVLEADSIRNTLINGYTVQQDSLADYAPITAPLTVVRQREHSLLLEGQPDEQGIRPRVRIILGPEQDIGFTYWFSNEGLGALTSSVTEVTTFPPDWEVSFSSTEVKYLGVEHPLSPEDSTYLLLLNPRELIDTVKASLLEIPVVFQNERFRIEKHTATKEAYRVLPGLSPLSAFPLPGEQLTKVVLAGDRRSVGYGETTNLRTRWVVKARRAGE
jgi:hypothetical protein